jgi:hypothetical protein
MLANKERDGAHSNALFPLFKRRMVAQYMTKVPQSIDWICGASMLIRPAVLETIGGM